MGFPYYDQILPSYLSLLMREISKDTLLLLAARIAIFSETFDRSLAKIHPPRVSLAGERFSRGQRFRFRGLYQTS